MTAPAVTNPSATPEAVTVSEPKQRIENFSVQFRRVATYVDKAASAL